MVEILALATIITPVTTGLVEGVKEATGAKKKFLPLVAVVIGLSLGAVAFPFAEIALVERLWAGGISGLASVGLFEGIKNVKGNDE